MEVANTSWAERAEPVTAKGGYYSVAGEQVSSGFIWDQGMPGGSHLGFKMSDPVRVNDQQERNEFANLLNRGSSLE